MRVIASLLIAVALFTPSLTYAALSTNLVSYWKLDESSGNAADSVGTNTLTNNGVTYVAAKINNGGDLESSGNTWFSITDAAQSGLDITGDMTICHWLNFETVTGASVTKYVDSGTISYRTFYNGTDIGFGISANGSAETFQTTAFTFSTATYYYVCFVYTAAAGSVQFYVNASSVATVSGYPNSIFNSASAFQVGRQNVDDAKFDGIVDEVGVWSRTLSGTEVTQLYNGGAGCQYPFSTCEGGGMQYIYYWLFWW